MNTNYLFKSFLTSLAIILTHGNGICQKNDTKISYTSFTVNAVDKKIMIDWVTDTSVTTNYFEIQRSADGKSFKTIALVFGPDPQKTNCDCYECFDKLSTTKQKYFYRLKHVGINGEVELSETKMLAIK